MTQNALWREDFGKKACLHFSYKNILLKYSKNMKQSPKSWHRPFHPLSHANNWLTQCFPIGPISWYHRSDLYLIGSIVFTCILPNQQVVPMGILISKLTRLMTLKTPAIVENIVAMNKSQYSGRRSNDRYFCKVVSSWPNNSNSCFSSSAVFSFIDSFSSADGFRGLFLGSRAINAAVAPVTKTNADRIRSPFLQPQ